jgi:hypothetical protein
MYFAVNRVETVKKKTGLLYIVNNENDGQRGRQEVHRLPFEVTDTCISPSTELILAEKENSTALFI